MDKTKFQLVDNFYLWEAEQCINNNRQRLQFQLVDNYWLYLAKLASCSLFIGQLAVEVTYVSATRTLTAVVSGGTAATYSWTIKSFTDIVGESNATFAGATNAQSAVLDPAPGTNAVGMACVKVTDTQGRIAYGYFAVRLQGTI